LTEYYIGDQFCCEHMLKIFFVAENLVLRARSETAGSAVNPAARGNGMLEYWNVGMLGLVDWYPFIYKDGPDQFIKSEWHPLSIPNIPLFHHSIIPFGV